MKSAAKLLRFPLGGLAKNGSYRDTTYPTDESIYSTPTALNVIGECAFASRMRGGSRPGLKKVSGVVSANTGKWLWPNGEGIIFTELSAWECIRKKDGITITRGPVFEEYYPGDNQWRWYLYYTTENDPSTEIRVPGYGHDPYGTKYSTRAWFGVNGSLYEELAYFTRNSDTTRLVFSDDDTATLPDESRMVLQHAPKAIYRDRYVKCEGTTWMASRTGDYGDFDFGGEAEDVTKPVAGNIADAGKSGENITAIAAFGDQRLYIATRRRLAVIAGEPTSAATTLSENVGIVGANAWCNADGILYFIGPNGLYGVGETGPMLVSQQLPDDLKGLSDALLVHDPHYGGIHIFTASGDYFYEFDHKAFWPISYPTAKRPTAGVLGVIDNINRVIFKCADGEYRYWDDAQTTDDGTAINSTVVIGPFKCGVNEGDGMLDEINVTLANGSADVTIDVTSGNTAEDVAEDETDVVRTFTASDGFNAAMRPRFRGGWAKLRLSATGRWAYESIYARIKTLGRLRP